MQSADKSNVLVAISEKERTFDCETMELEESAISTNKIVAHSMSTEKVVQSFTVSTVNDRSDDFVPSSVNEIRENHELSSIESSLNSEAVKNVFAEIYSQTYEFDEEFPVTFESQWKIFQKYDENMYLFTEIKYFGYSPKVQKSHSMNSRGAVERVHEGNISKASVFKPLNNSGSNVFIFGEVLQEAHPLFSK